MGRVSVLMLITALALMLGLGADILLAATAGPAGVHDGDWVVLTVVVAFVALTVFRLGWAQRLAFGVVLGTLGLLIVELSLMATAAAGDAAAGSLSDSLRGGEHDRVLLSGGLLQLAAAIGRAIRASGPTGLGRQCRARRPHHKRSSHAADESARGRAGGLLGGPVRD